MESLQPLRMWHTCAHIHSHIQGLKHGQRPTMNTPELLQDAWQQAQPTCDTHYTGTQHKQRCQ